jgi:hypothetical protein
MGTTARHTFRQPSPGSSPARSSSRRGYLRAVLESARVTDDVVAPWTRVPGLDAAFASEADLLVDLHQEWIRLLVGRIHRGGVVAQRTPANVRDLVDEVRAENPTLRRILDTHEADPALWSPTAKEHAMLARVAGLATDDASTERASALGRALVTQRIPVQQRAAAS